MFENKILYNKRGGKMNFEDYMLILAFAFLCSLVLFAIASSSSHDDISELKVLGKDNSIYLQPSHGYMKKASRLSFANKTVYWLKTNETDIMVSPYDYKKYKVNDIIKIKKNIKTSEITIL